MDGFFDVIFGNLFLILAVVYGIIGFLSNYNKDKQKKQKKQQQRRSMRPVQERTQPAAREVKKPEEAEVQWTQPVSAEEVIHQEQQLQMERLEAKYGVTSSNEIEDDLRLDDLQFQEPLTRNVELSEEQKVLKKDLKGSLKGSGLINGVIMAEVLGKPRSLKPYQSVIQERYKK